jgi:glycosyltransferase involved in cell wall biosynthesis
MSLQISVLICTHNPNRERLTRVLRALQAQTLDPRCWEIVLIDNASEPPVTSIPQDGGKVRVRMLREPHLGKTIALLHGIRESFGELLVVVDDDNVLDPSYLENAINIAAAHPFIGAFGGSISGEFEEPPPHWATHHLLGLAICEIDRDYWSNLTNWSLAVPYGAGMCFRRSVADDYAAKVSINSLRRGLDRVGTSLTSAGDVDLAFCAVDLGMGTGRFRALTMKHLIPKSRLTLDYFTRLSAGIAFSELILKSFRAKVNLNEVPRWRQLISLALTIARTPWREWRIPIAIQKAQREARALLASHPSQCAPSNSA